MAGWLGCGHGGGIINSRQLAFLNSGYTVEMRAKAHRRWPRNVKSRPRDHQKLSRSVRFTPRGSEKRALGNFIALRIPRFIEFGIIDGKIYAHFGAAKHLGTFRAEMRGEVSAPKHLRTFRAEMRGEVSAPKHLRAFRADGMNVVESCRDAYRW